MADRLLREALGTSAPAALKALWRQCAGVYDVRGGEFLPDSRALMDPDWVVRFYQDRMRYQEQHGDEEFPSWKRSWIPVCAFNAHDAAFGLCLDTVTGGLWHWSRYGDQRPEAESLTVFLEEMADALVAPSLAGLPKPGLVEGGLSWGPPSDPDREALWTPVAG
ncbi:SMI1/KNR4 family protein [Streptomyces sp. NPDC005151]